MLSQYQAEESPNEWATVGYWSKTLTKDMRWHLGLMEFDYKILYHPVLVHQVPDALSLIPQPDTGLNDAVEIDTKIPSFNDFPTR